MKPKFTTTQDWEKGQLLMQPALIRVVDNVRKQLETSDWKGTYEDVETPIPGYHLCLTREEETVKVDIWTLCFEICFLNYNPNNTGETQEVTIDNSLIDETGEVNWQCLDDKTQRVVMEVFEKLPK
ncbi:MAG: hypothetical protein ACOC0N_01140 [Chroococcales cyanobacterium]